MHYWENNFIPHNFPVGTLLCSFWRSLARLSADENQCHSKPSMELHRFIPAKGLAQRTEWIISFAAYELWAILHICKAVHPQSPLGNLPDVQFLQKSVRLLFPNHPHFSNALFSPSLILVAVLGSFSLKRQGRTEWAQNAVSRTASSALLVRSVLALWFRIQILQVFLLLIMMLLLHHIIISCLY